MAVKAYINPVDWDNFLAMLHSLPIPPSEEDEEFLSDRISEVPESYEIFGRAAANDFRENLKRIRLGREQKRELNDIFTLLFPLEFTDEFTVDRHFPLSEFNLDYIYKNLCSPQEVGAIYQKLTQLEPAIAACADHIDGSFGYDLQRIKELCERYSREGKGFLTYWI